MELMKEDEGLLPFVNSTDQPLALFKQLPELRTPDPRRESRGYFTGDRSVFRSGLGDGAYFIDLTIPATRRASASLTTAN